ncbi:hypothetical protein MCOR25_002681 [Pyricularia grisea]|uniref:Hikeshi-like domain-containing protein n=1 Tax=Pyricularia grisea TaxID=148305 RepID=A0A6P8B917_PYRGI|nr:uncharacterized protein PgNI_03277 [Pyricularia grisea]KAI6376716.1 hypothetical protein MCOR25_002681 [Pyricularia grisea]TLD12137.1 hypothetical protein PgNI_03277 [Pyricularia grisea]
MAQQPLFGLVPANLPLVTDPTEVISPTSFIYSIPPVRAFSHIVIFLLPGVALPENTAAAIYLVTPPPTPGAPPGSKFLGGIGPGKESAIFNLKGSLPTQTDGAPPVVIGVSIEPADSVAARIAEVKAASSSAAGNQQQQQQQQSNALVVRPSTLVLAQRIIQNAFNFLAGFSGTAGQVEVVPLKAFEDWWKKFESKVRTDPGFLERGEQ